MSFMAVMKKNSVYANVKEQYARADCQSLTTTEKTVFSKAALNVEDPILQGQ